MYVQEKLNGGWSTLKRFKAGLWKLINCLFNRLKVWLKRVGWSTMRPFLLSAEKGSRKHINPPSWNGYLNCQEWEWVLQQKQQQQLAIVAPWTAGLTKTVFVAKTGFSSFYCCTNSIWIRRRMTGCLLGIIIHFCLAREWMDPSNANRAGACQRWQCSLTKEPLIFHSPADDLWTTANSGQVVANAIGDWWELDWGWEKWKGGVWMIWHFFSQSAVLIIVNYHMA